MILVYCYFVTTYPLYQGITLLGSVAILRSSFKRNNTLQNITNQTTLNQENTLQIFKIF